VRSWLTPNCLLVVLMLIVAPGAALAHLLLNWMPMQLEVVRLDRTLARDTATLEAELEQGATLQRQTAKLREIIESPKFQSRWLPRRDRDGVFDRLAEAFRQDGVSIEQLTFDQPGFYAAATYGNLLACERVTVLCAGNFAGLSACLDRLPALEMPLAVRDLTWSRADDRLLLALKLDVPFVPDDALRKKLAEEAGLSEEIHEP
jgi:hypothetical protein